MKRESIIARSADRVVRSQGVGTESAFRSVDDSSISPRLIEMLEHTARLPVVRRARDEAVRSLVAGHDSKILDLGCGLGFEAKALFDAGAVVTAVDSSNVLLAEARRRRPAHDRLIYVNCDARNLPYEDCSYDGALMSRVLMHIKEPRVVLREVRRVVKIDGRFAIIEPDWTTLASFPRSDTFQAIAGHFHSVIVSGDLAQQLPQLLSDNGFTVISRLTWPCEFRSFDNADKSLGLIEAATMSVDTGVLDRGQAEDWIATAKADGARFNLSLTLTLATKLTS